MTVRNDIVNGEFKFAAPCTVEEFFEQNGGESQAFGAGGAAAAEVVVLGLRKRQNRSRRLFTAFLSGFAVATIGGAYLFNSKMNDLRGQEAEAAARTASANTDIIRLRRENAALVAPFEEAERVAKILETTDLGERGYLTLLDMHTQTARNIKYSYYNKLLKRGRIGDNIMIKLPNGSPLKTQNDGTYQIITRNIAPSPTP